MLYYLHARPKRIPQCYLLKNIHCLMNTIKLYSMQIPLFRLYKIIISSDAQTSQNTMQKHLIYGIAFYTIKSDEISQFGAFFLLLIFIKRKCLNFMLN